MSYNLREILFCIIFVFILMWFTFQAVYFAVTIPYGIPPDEIYHYTKIKKYSETKGLYLENTPKEYHLGNFKNSFFYHLLIGKLLKLNPFKMPNLLFIRLVSVIFGIITIIFAYLTIRECIQNRIIQITILIVLTNLLMYAFLFGSASYDNLVNLLSAVSFYGIIKFQKTFQRKYLFYLLLTLLVGTLTKITYFPLALIELVIVAVLIVNNKANIGSLLTPPVKFPEVLISIFLALLIVINIYHFGSNLVKYHTLEPELSQVHQNDQIATPHQIRNKNLEKAVDSRARMNFVSYFYQWYGIMKNRTIGIVGHASLYKDINNLQSRLINIFIGIAMILLVANYKSCLKNKAFIILFTISFGYCLFLFCFNYNSYLSTHAIDIAVQGRYIFPVLPLLVAVLIYLLMFKLLKNLQLILSGFVSILSIYEGFFYFLRFGGRLVR